MKAILKVDFEKIKKGNEVEVIPHFFDSVYKENTFWIKNTNFWLPESELEFNINK